MSLVVASRALGAMISWASHRLNVVDTSPNLRCLRRVLVRQLGRQRKVGRRRHIG